MIVRPTASFLVAHPAHLIALGFGSGLAPVAPGTVGTLLGFPLYAVLAQWLSPFEVLLLLPLLFILGVWACSTTGAALGIGDHSSMVWDEIVAFMLILVFTPPGLAWQTLAFLAFRAFDVLKPLPIRSMEQRWKGGFGVMVDDIMAAFYALLVIAIVKRALT
jgi:phosphatidylglycerophosphatase A